MSIEWSVLYIEYWFGKITYIVLHIWYMLVRIRCRKPSLSTIDQTQTKKIVNIFMAYIENNFFLFD